MRQAYTGAILTAAFDITGEDALGRLESLIDRMEGIDLLVFSLWYGTY